VRKGESLVTHRERERNGGLSLQKSRKATPGNGLAGKTQKKGEAPLKIRGRQVHGSKGSWTKERENQKGEEKFLHLQAPMNHQGGAWGKNKINGLRKELG